MFTDANDVPDTLINAGMSSPFQMIGWPLWWDVIWAEGISRGDRSPDVTVKENGRYKDPWQEQGWCVWRAAKKPEALEGSEPSNEGRDMGLEGQAVSHCVRPERGFRFHSEWQGVVGSDHEDLEITRYTASAVDAPRAPSPERECELCVWWTSNICDTGHFKRRGYRQRVYLRFKVRKLFPLVWRKMEASVSSMDAWKWILPTSWMCLEEDSEPQVEPQPWPASLLQPRTLFTWRAT